MIERFLKNQIIYFLQNFPVVAILGPRQIGKTTLAQEVAPTLAPNPIYLDLESPSDLSKLQEPELYFDHHARRLIILDEIQELPDIFKVLRGVVDRRRRAGEKAGQFLILGSASLELLRQSSETLAGRITYIELSGFTEIEINTYQPKQSYDLWLRGGFPDSFLATTEQASYEWRLAFIKSYLERDVPHFGLRIPASTLQRFWTMLAHCQGGLVNANRLAASMGLSSMTIHRYLDLLVDLLLVRKLMPWAANHGKRLVRSPKIYLRDSGILHGLLQIPNFEILLGHPIAGLSWEGYVIENLLAIMPLSTPAYFYRTSAGAEIDLLLDLGPEKRVAIEIKRSLAPTLSKGFYIGCEDVNANFRFLVYPGKEKFPLAKDTIALPLLQLMNELLVLNSLNLQG